MSRYELLIRSIQDTDDYIVKLFLFSILTVLAYPVLGWTPSWIRKPAQLTYLATALILFMAVLILGSGV